MNILAFVTCVVLASVLPIGMLAEENTSSKDDTATKCYTCNELEASGCKDPFDAKQATAFLTTCQNDEKFCRKTVQTVNGKSSIIRQCAKELYKPNFEGCYKTAGKASQHVCTCKGIGGEPCNNGRLLKSSALASLVLPILFALY